MLKRLLTKRHLTHRYNCHRLTTWLVFVALCRC